MTMRHRPRSQGLSGFLLALGTVLCLGACQGSGEAAGEGPGEASPAGSCDPDRYTHWVGMTIAAAGKGSPDAGVLGLEKVPKPFRLIEPNSMVTQDYRPERLNLYLDGNGVITRVTCG